MKVIHVLNTMKFSGAENVAVGICEGLRERGVEVAYVSRDGMVGDVIRGHGIKFVGLKDLSVGEVRRVLREEKADVVHAHDIFAGVVCALATIGTGCRLVTTLHNNDFENRRISVKSLLYLIALTRASRALFVSKSCRDGYIFHKWFEKKSEVLGNIIDTESVIEKGGRREKKWDIVAVGRITIQKDPMRLLKVVDMIRERIADVKVAVVGNGDMFDEVKEAVAKSGLEDNIEMMGFRSDAIEIMGASKVMLMTSRWEGTPMAVLEAMALKVPVVSTPVDGLKDVVGDKWLCETDEELASAVVDLLDNGSDDYLWYKGMSRDEYFERLMRAY